MVEDAPVLRIEKAEWEALRLNLPQEQQTITFIAVIKFKAIWHGDVGLDDIPSVTENRFVALGFNGGPRNVAEIGLELLKKLWSAPHVSTLLKVSRLPPIAAAVWDMMPSNGTPFRLQSLWRTRQRIAEVL
ncbi:MAG: hypothetical protein QF511_10135 [Rhodospirillales bacterium]|nr:hypothetical protein [Rhodospirillales bacterium]MDP7098847.1 hypothetical protein [Rhodospirillales bacterium]